MKLHILLTEEVKATMPDSVKEIFNAGRIQVVFPALVEGQPNDNLFGDNAIVEGETSEIIKWLKPFDGVAIGDGVPMLEHFTIMHINDEL